MIDEAFLMPECYVDTELVRIIRSKWPNHIRNGIGNVAKEMQNKKWAGKTVIGIVDNDKNQPPYFKGFKIIKQSSSTLLKKHPDNNHYLIVICPAAEDWLTNCAAVANVEMKIKNPDEFKRVCKLTKVDPRIKDLLNTLLQKKAPPMMEVKGWIEEALKGK